MRIAIASASFPSRQDEDPVFPATWELARALRRLGHELLVMTFCNEADPEDTEREVQIDGIRVLRKRRDKSKYAAFSGSPVFTIFSWQAGRARELFVKCADALSEFKPDVLECQEFNGLGFFFGAQHKCPLVVRCYGPASMFMRSGDIGKFSLVDVELTEAMELATLNAADGLIAVSHDIAERLSGLSERPLADFRVIRLPLTVPEALQAKCNRRSADDFPVLFFWGRVERQKGADLLIDALPEVVAKYPRARLWIGGSESVEHGEPVPYAVTMRSKLDELGLSDRVSFLGFLERKEIRERVSEADICLFPSHYETGCYTALEALCDSGCVLAGRVGGLAEYQSHGESAWLVEPADGHALAEGIVRLSDDQALRTRLSQSGREHVAAVCNPEKIAIESLKAYEEAIEHFASRQAKADLPFKTLTEHIGLALEDKTAGDTYHEICQEYLSQAWHAGYEAAMLAAKNNNGTEAGLFEQLLSVARRLKRKLNI